MLRGLASSGAAQAQWSLSFCSVGGSPLTYCLSTPLFSCLAVLERSMAVSSESFAGPSLSEPLWELACVPLSSSSSCSIRQPSASFSWLSAFLLTSMDFLCIPCREETAKPRAGCLSCITAQFLPASQGKPSLATSLSQPRALPLALCSPRGWLVAKLVPLL